MVFAFWFFFVLIFFFLKRAYEAIINNSKIKQNYLLKMNNNFFK